jgi:hypothetical protein
MKSDIEHLTDIRAALAAESTTLEERRTARLAAAHAAVAILEAERDEQNRYRAFVTRVTGGRGVGSAELPDAFRHGIAELKPAQSNASREVKEIEEEVRVINLWLADYRRSIAHIDAYLAAQAPAAKNAASEPDREARPGPEIPIVYPAGAPVMELAR